MAGVKKFIYDAVKTRPLHFSVIDPDIGKLGDVKEKSVILEELGTDAIMLGGSTNVKRDVVDKTVQIIKQNTSLPVISFPSGMAGVSRFSDAVFFMSLLNSKDPYWITRVQSAAAPAIRKMGIEVMSMAYLIFEPGMTVGRVGKAELIGRNDFRTAIGYALAAQYFGMDIVFMEGGSGASEPIPAKTIREIRKAISLPILVSGGFSKRGDLVKDALKAGADIIGTGNLTEENFGKLEKIIKTVKSFRKNQ